MAFIAFLIKKIDKSFSFLYTKFMANINYIEKHLRTYTVNAHKHHYWEIIYVTEGKGQLELPNNEVYPYSEDDILCIPPDLIHKNVSSSGFKNLHLTIDGFQLKIKNPIILSKSETSKDFASLLEMCYKYFHLLPGDHEINYSLSNTIVSFLKYLLNNNKISPIAQTISNIIINNYTDPDFDLNSIYSELPYSKEHSRKIFLKDFNVSPTKFLLNKRIELAKQMLTERKTSNYSIKEISKSCGFFDQLYFSRVFRRETGVAPKDYKTSMIENNKIFENNKD